MLALLPRAFSVNTVHRLGRNDGSADGMRVVSESEPSATSADARPLQVDGRDGTVDTGAWKTVSTSKAGSNVLIPEGIDRETAVKDHQDFLTSDEAKSHKVYSTSYQVPYTPSRSHPEGGHVGKSYTEFFVPKASDSSPKTYKPSLVSTGYFKNRNDRLEKRRQAELDAAERKERIHMRLGVCILCDNAVRTGRIIVENEVDRLKGESMNARGLVSLVETTCNLMTENYHAEVQNLNCGKVSAAVSKYYDAKFEGQVHGGGKVTEHGGMKYVIKGKSRRVNFALTAALQSCSSLFGITFCDADSKIEDMPGSSASPTTPVQQQMAGKEFVLESAPTITAQIASLSTPIAVSGDASVAPPVGGCDTSMPDCQPGAVVTTAASINDPLPSPPKSFSEGSISPAPASSKLQNNANPCNCDCCSKPKCACSSVETTEAQFGVSLKGVSSKDITDDVVRSLKHMLSALLMLDDTAISIQTPDSQSIRDSNDVSLFSPEASVSSDIVDPASLLTERRRRLLGEDTSDTKLIIVVECDSVDHVRIVKGRFKKLCGQKLEAAIVLVLPSATRADCISDDDAPKVSNSTNNEDAALEDSGSLDSSNIGKELNDTGLPLDDAEETAVANDTDVSRNASGAQEDGSEDIVEDAGAEEDEGEVGKENKTAHRKANADAEDGDGNEDEDEDENEDEEKSDSLKKKEIKHHPMNKTDGSDEAGDNKSGSKSQDSLEDSDLDESGGDAGENENTTDSAALASQDKSDKEGTASTEKEIDELEEEISNMSETLAEKTKLAAKKTGNEKSSMLRDIDNVTTRLESAKKALDELSDDTSREKNSTREDGDNEDEGDSANNSDTPVENKSEKDEDENGGDEEQDVDTGGKVTDSGKEDIEEDTDSESGTTSNETDNLKGTSSTEEGGGENQDEDEDKDSGEKNSVEKKNKTLSASPSFRSRGTSLRGVLDLKKGGAEKHTKSFFLPKADISGDVSLDDVLKANGI